MSAPRIGPWNVLTRSLVPAGLIISGIIHFDVASSYDQVHPGAMGQDSLFRIVGMVMFFVALLVLVTGTRGSFISAALVGLGAFGFVVLYTYVDVGRVGIIPNLYESHWYYEKVLSAVADAAAGLLAVSEVFRLRTVRHEVHVA